MKLCVVLIVSQKPIRHARTVRDPGRPEIGLKPANTDIIADY